MIFIKDSRTSGSWKSLITDDNKMSDEIHARISADNRRYYALGSVLRSRNINRKLKIKIYKTILRPTVRYGSEAWTLLVREERWIT